MTDPASQEDASCLPQGGSHAPARERTQGGGDPESGVTREGRCVGFRTEILKDPEMGFTLCFDVMLEHAIVQKDAIY